MLVGNCEESSVKVRSEIFNEVSKNIEPVFGMGLAFGKRFEGNKIDLLTNFKFNLSRIVGFHGHKSKYVSFILIYNIVFIDIAALIFASYINLIYFNKIMIFLLISSNWIPQIYRNTIKGLKDAPSISLAFI